MITRRALKFRWRRRIKDEDGRGGGRIPQICKATFLRETQSEDIFYRPGAIEILSLSSFSKSSSISLTCIISY